MLFYLVSVLYAKLYLSMETRYGHITAIMVKTYQDLIKLIGMKLYLIFIPIRMERFMLVIGQNFRVNIAWSTEHLTAFGHDRKASLHGEALLVL